jgi:hypothetical protein
MRVTPSVSALRYEAWRVIGRDGLSNTPSRKLLSFETFRHSKKRGRRGMKIEYALIAFLLAFAGLQAYFAFGAKGI